MLDIDATDAEFQEATKALQGTWQATLNEIRQLRRQAALDAIDLDRPLVIGPALPAGQCFAPELSHVEQAITRAIAYWKMVIKEPPAGLAGPINSFIMEAMGWASGVHPSPKKGTPYRENGDFAWCGAFVAACFPGIPIEVLRRYFASCYRLVAEWAKGTARHVPLDQVQRGDILVVGPDPTLDGVRWWGSHITLVIERIGDRILTIEGNGIGRFPDGTNGEGVIKDEYSLSRMPRRRRQYRPRHVVRPLPEDFRMEAA